MLVGFILATITSLPSSFFSPSLKILKPTASRLSGTPKRILISLPARRSCQCRCMNCPIVVERTKSSCQSLVVLLHLAGRVSVLEKQFSSFGFDRGFFGEVASGRDDSSRNDRLSRSVSERRASAAGVGVDFGDRRLISHGLFIPFHRE